MTDKSYSLTITKEQLAELPRVEFPGVIKVVNTAAEARKAVSILKKYPILGFDTESKPTFRKGVPIHVSLIQISADDVCFLFRVRKIDDLEPLHEIMDLQKLVPDYNFGCSSLQKIYAILFDMKISKSQQLSNWDAETLTEAQTSYAAIDAWACIRIYRRLLSDAFVPEESKYKVIKSTDNEN